MPEGPEIKQAANRIAKAIEGKVCDEIFFAFDHLQHFEDEFLGKEIISVKPRGKALLIRFENDLTIYSHNQLYGRWVIRNRGNFPKTNRQLRLAIHNQKKSALLYSASDIEVLTNDEIANHPFLSNLGPDILDEETDVALIRERLRDPKYERRRLGHLLLDQKWLSGLGNYLRSEILFVAKLPYDIRPKDLTKPESAKLAKIIHKLTVQAYETRGITNNLRVAKKMKADGYRRSQYRHYVFARAGRQCYECGEIIEKLYVGSRRLYICSQCQMGE